LGKVGKGEEVQREGKLLALVSLAFGDFDFISIDFDVFRHYASGCDQVEMFRAPN
jgi:hypothetical protein